MSLVAPLSSVGSFHLHHLVWTRIYRGALQVYPQVVELETIRKSWHVLSEICEWCQLHPQENEPVFHCSRKKLSCSLHTDRTREVWSGLTGTGTFLRHLSDICHTGAVSARSQIPPAERWITPAHSFLTCGSHTHSPQGSRKCSGHSGLCFINIFINSNKIKKWILGLHF